MVGLGATGGVWGGYDGLAPDLPGHGSAPWESSYSFEQLAALVPDPMTLPGLGHNAHVEDPAAVLALLG